MNKFYTYPKWIQWTVTGLLTAMILAVMGIWLEMTASNPLNYFWFLFFIPFLQFGLTPLFRFLKFYHYLSPMLLVYAPSPQKYDLHNGTSFDYLFVMRGVPPGHTFQQVMLTYYLEGLLEVIRLLESGAVPLTVEIVGTSYFFSENTAKRLGFSLAEPSTFYKFNIYVNYLDLTWMYSLSKGKFTLPRVDNIKKATTTGAQLVERKAYILKLYERLQASVAGQQNLLEERWKA